MVWNTTCRCTGGPMYKSGGFFRGRFVPTHKMVKGFIKVRGTSCARCVPCCARAERLGLVDMWLIDAYFPSCEVILRREAHQRVSEVLLRERNPPGENRSCNLAGFELLRRGRATPRPKFGFPLVTRTLRRCSCGKRPAVRVVNLGWSTGL